MPDERGEATFKKVDASWLPDAWKAQVPPGVVVQYYQNGQLKSLGLGALTLELELDITSARITYGKSGWQNYYADGTIEHFNPWSDNEKPAPENWEKWVKKQIAWIYTEANK